VSVDLRLAMDLPILMSAGAANWEVFLVFSRSLQGLLHLVSFLSHWIMYIFGKIFAFPEG